MPQDLAWELHGAWLGDEHLDVSQERREHRRAWTSIAASYGAAEHL